MIVLSSGVKLPALEDVQGLYDKCRFVDAFGVTEGAWRSRDLGIARELPLEHLILGSRLAMRLGGRKTAVYLGRNAAARYPGAPLVRIYARGGFRQRYSLVDDLRQFESEGGPGSPDPRLQALWLAAYAMSWAVARNFRKTHELLDRAMGLGVETGYLLSCESHVLALEDKWEESLEKARSSWAEAPGSHFAARALGGILGKTGKISQAIKTLLEHALKGQSFEIAVMVCEFLCSMAEKAEKGKAETWAKYAAKLLDRLEALSPLADQDVGKYILSRRFDVAGILEDRSAMAECAEGIKSPFFLRMRERLGKQKGGRKTILPFRPVYQKHVHCLPASIETVLSAFGVTLDQERIGKELTFAGTSLVEAANYLVSKGLAVRHFIADPEIIRALMSKGIPFVICSAQESFSHATAAVGFDEGLDLLLVHDPVSIRLEKHVVSEFGSGELPLGPILTVIVPEGRQADLDGLPLESSEASDAILRFFDVQSREGVAMAGKVIEGLVRGHPDHPVGRYLDAVRREMESSHAAAFGMFKTLISEFPECYRIRSSLISCCETVGNTALALNALRQVVEGKTLPGTSSSQEWREAPSTYVCRYAEIMGRSAALSGRACQLLRRVVKREPHNARAYLLLGRILRDGGGLTESVDHFWIASTLNLEDNDAAREYSDLLRRLGRGSEGLGYLEQRALDFSDLRQSGSTWIELIDAQMDYGFPELARETMDTVLEKFPDDFRVRAFAVHFWVRMGDWVRAGAILGALEGMGQRTTYLRCAINVFRQSGHWREAIDVCRELVEAEPYSIDAKRNLLQLVSMKEGRRKVLDTSREWTRENPDHEDYERILYENLGSLGKFDDQVALLNRRVERYPEDAWAWLELGHLFLETLEGKKVSERRKKFDELMRISAQCSRTNPDKALSCVLRGRICEFDGDMAGSLKNYFLAIESEPGYWYPYHRIWTLSLGMAEAEQCEILGRLEGNLLKCTGHLELAPMLSAAIAERFGVPRAEEALARWCAVGSRDPELIVARASLLVFHGQGRTDAARASEILKEGLALFPDHFDLEYLYAKVCSILLDNQQELQVLRKLVARFPLRGNARRCLAQALVLTGETEETVKVLTEGIDFSPLDSSLRMFLSDILWNSGDHDNAKRALQDGLALMPEDFRLRENLISLLLNRSMDDAAIAEAVLGTELFPTDAHSWYILGDTLHRSQSNSDVKETEKALKRALDLNVSLSDAAVTLMNMFIGQSRFKEAHGLLDRHGKVTDNPEVVGRCRAWLLRREDRKKEAYNELHGHLKTYPGSEWAWSVLMDWFLEDRKWTTARESLRALPAAVMNNASIRGRRLKVLALAGESHDHLEPEWKSLLADFPRDLDLHADFFDILLDEEEAVSRAEEVLERMEEHHSDSPAVILRRMRISVHDGDTRRAIDCAVRIWTKPGDDESDDSDRAWEILSAQDWEQDAANEVLRVLVDGRRINIQAAFMLAWILRCRMKPGIINWITGKRTVEAVDSLEHLNRVYQRSSWNDGAYSATVLHALNDIGRHDRVIFFHEENPSFAASCTRVWEEVGRAMLGRKGKLAAREWFSGWRGRGGVRMGSLVSYLDALRVGKGIFFDEPGDLEELYRTSKDALSTLPHDHAAANFAAALCESCLRLDRDREFLAALRTFRNYVEDGCGEEDGRGLKDLPAVFEAFEALLSPGGTTTLRRLNDVIGRFVFPPHPGWIGREWLRRLKAMGQTFMWIQLWLTWAIRRRLEDFG